jgi:hypothetical protein
MWSRHTFSLPRLEPTRIGVGSVGSKMDSVVGVRGSTLAARWTLVEPGWLGTASGVRAASMGGVNSEGRDFINWHASP